MKILLVQIAFVLSIYASMCNAQSCAIPSNLIINNMAATTASVSWSAVSGAINYKVRYKKPEAATWKTITANGTSAVLANLTASTTYWVCVKTTCASGSSAFSSKSNFTTLVNIQTDSLVTAYSNWKYLVTPSDQGSVWRTNSYVETGWSSGNAELGYGDGDEATVLGYGADANNKYATTYFRKSFQVTNASVYNSLSLGIVRDDGAIVYINGTEAVRSNMPTGSVTYATYSSTNLTGASESAWNYFSINPALLINGNNTIAIELHQSNATSADISLNVKLAASNDSGRAVLIRGAYLEVLTPNSITIQWKTDKPCNSKVRYGANLTYGNVLTDTNQTTNHIVKLTGLTSNKKYFYTIGSAAQDLQGDEKNYFKTALTAASTQPFRVWATGDFGNGSVQQIAVRDAFKSYTTAKPANFWIWLGDDAYEGGFESEFQSNVFNMYTDIFKSLPVFPCPGNHEYNNVGYQSASALTTNWPYFDLFTVPVNAEAGGIASGTKKYYSYNYGNAHFISLDSYGVINDTSGTMYHWLQNDLNANTKRWTVVYWHHPPYTMGSHNSDTDAELTNMRTRILPLLEQHKVDLVLCGHSHVYERSFLLNGHYGLENTLTIPMKLDGSDGLSPYYQKTAANNQTGTVYVVCGISGKGANATVQTSWPHAAMYKYDNTIYGSMIIDFNKDTLDVKCLISTGTIFDQFKIVKSGATKFESNNLFVLKTDEDADVYPNPFTDVLTIQNIFTEDKNALLEIYDLQGKKIYSKQIERMPLKQGENNLIQLTAKDFDYMTGLFMVVIKSKDRIIKNLVERIE